MSGPQKAAVLLLQLGPDRSAEVLKLLSESEIAEISTEVARLHKISPEMVKGVLSEVKDQVDTGGTAIATGGLSTARALLEESLGAERAGDILSKVRASMNEAPFRFLRHADPSQILSFLQEEHPQTITLVLAHMSPDQAAMVLSGLNEELQRDVAHRLAVMDRTSPEVIDEVQRQLERKLASVLQPNELSAVGGVQCLVDILNRSDRATERLILDALDESNPELADEIRQKMFLFGDIVRLDDRAVQLILRNVDIRGLAVALKGVGVDVREKITKNMSQRAAENLLDEIEMLGPVRLKTVEEAQGAIVRVIRSLEESGQLVLMRSGDEFVD